MKKRINISSLKRNGRTESSTQNSFATSALTDKDLSMAVGGVSYASKALHENHYQYKESGTVELISSAAAC